VVSNAFEMLRKRSAFGKKKQHTGKTVNVSGAISKILQPEQMENFNGYAIVMINGNVVKGYFPFLDLNFSYNFHCYLVNNPYRGPEHEIDSPGSPPFTPLPLTRERLCAMLKKELNMPDSTARDIVSNMERDPRLSQIDFDNMDPQKLLTSLAPTPDWLEHMAQHSLYFRYPFVRVLHNFWDSSDLSGLNITKLLSLATEFEEHPEFFAYSWLNTYNLPELSFEKVQLAFRLLKKEEPRNLFQRMAIYQNCKFQAERRGRPCIVKADLEEWGLRIEPAVGAKLVRPDGVYNPSTGLNIMYYFAMPQWDDLQTIVAGLARLNARALSPNLWLRKPRPIGLAYAQLNAQQQFLVDSSKKYGFMIWNAGAGTGKTTTALSSAALASRRMTMPVAYFGRVASNLRKTWDHGITIHRLWHLVKNETEQGNLYKKYVRRVFIDEGSHLTMELLAMVFRACPNLEQLIFMGDAAQMRPPSGIPVYEALIAFYADTPIVQTLTEVMRVDRTNADSAATLVENGQKLREGKLDLVYSRTLLAENPFVIVPRIEIPGELYVIDANAPATRQKRVEIMKQTLRPVLTYLRSFQNYQMLALRHDTIADMNMAISQIQEETPSNGLRQERVFKLGSKIMFSQNFYPQQELKLPKDRSKRVQMLTSYKWRSRTTQINNNEICTILKIVDIDPESGEEYEVHDTSVLRANPSFQRILRLDTGGQVNLSVVPMSRIFCGDVSTISSSQGGEWDIVFLYMDSRDCALDGGKLHTLMKRDAIYTVFTRAKRQVIIACRAAYDDLIDSDLGRVVASERPPPDLILHKWLPPYQGQIIQSVAAVDSDHTDISQEEAYDSEEASE
jgi:hypothetical protein